MEVGVCEGYNGVEDGWIRLNARFQRLKICGHSTSSKHIYDIHHHHTNTNLILISL